jgi:regulatory protein
LPKPSSGAGRRARVPRQRGGDRAPLDATAALEVALTFLGSRPRTAREVEDRLRRTTAEDGVIATTMDRLRELGYVDDVAFARWWSEQRDRHAPRGRRLLEAELWRKGVPRDVIEQLRDAPVERLPEDMALPETDDQRAAVALDGHLRGRPLPDDPRALQRIGMFLMRRGFDPETARRAIRAHGSGEPADG